MASRRNFIHQSTILSLLSVIPWQASASQSKKLGVALTGLGYYSGDLLAPALQLTEHCELRGIITGTPAKIPRWQSRYRIKDQNVYNYKSISKVRDNADIDVVYIVVPTGLHAKYSVMAAEAGKHVWCEKPMARTAKECQQIIDACRANGVKLSIGYRMQHEPNTQTVMEWGKNKPYGEIKSVIAEAGYFDGRSDHWKQNKELGGGAMYDMGVYPLNAARYAMGQEPVSVRAWHQTNRPNIYDEVDETTIFELTFPNGAVAKCRTSLGEGMNRLEVDAENGSYYLRPMQAYSGVRGAASDGTKLDQSIRNQQAKQMDDDALAIINNTDVLVPGEEGQRDIRIVEAIYESAAKDGQVVTL